MITLLTIMASLGWGGFIASMILYHRRYTDRLDTLYHDLDNDFIAIDSSMMNAIKSNAANVHAKLTDAIKANADIVGEKLMDAIKQHEAAVLAAIKANKPADIDVRKELVAILTPQAAPPTPVATWPPVKGSKWTRIDDIYAGRLFIATGEHTSSVAQFTLMPYGPSGCRTTCYYAESNMKPFVEGGMDAA